MERIGGIWTSRIDNLSLNAAARGSEILGVFSPGLRPVLTPCRRCAAGFCITVRRFSTIACGNYYKAIFSVSLW